MPITVPEVTKWLGMTTPDTTMAETVATVNVYVARLPVVQNLDDGQAWPADVQQGAVMLAARYNRRRNSPNGVEAITEGGAQYIARHDSDISRLLQLDGFQAPQIG